MSEIPQTTVLSEASADSLSELLSRDPEDGTMDRPRLITAFRAQRARFLAAEAAKPFKEKKTSVKGLLTTVPASTVNVGDLGL